MHRISQTSPLSPMPLFSTRWVSEPRFNMLFLFSLTSWTLLCRLAPKLGLSCVPFWRFMLHFQTFMEAEAELHSSELFSTKWSNVIGRRRALKPWHQYSEPLLRQTHRQTGRKRLKLAAEKQQSSILQHRCAFSRPAAGPRPHFGLLLIKPIMSWNVFLVVFAVCQHVWSRECVREPATERVCVCVLYKIQSHQPQPHRNNTTQGDSWYWSVYHPHEQ